jgi:DNA-binding PadR family transcriptional regulator
MIEPVQESGRRRPYRLTASGAAELSDALAEIRAIADEGSRRLAARVTFTGALA